MTPIAERLAQLSARQRALLAQRLPRPRDPGAAKQLVVYVVPTPTATLNVSDLRAFLGERLPSYMLPAQMMVLDMLPKMPNGKVDRQRLPEPMTDVGASAADVITPRTALEQQLADIWMALLGADMLDVRDNFFELGGHSLLVTQMTARVRQMLQVSLPVSAVFETPTLEGLAARIAALQLTTRTAEADAEREEIEL